MDNMRIASKGWEVMKAIYSICIKICDKYTDCDENPKDAINVSDTLECVQGVKCMLNIIKECVYSNPRKILNAKKLDFITFLINKCRTGCKAYLNISSKSQNKSNSH